MEKNDIYHRLISLLITDQRLVSTEGNLLKNKVMEVAEKIEPDFLKLLLSDEIITSNFFVKVAEILVFDKEKFIQFVTNKRFLPDSYTVYKNKIGLTSNGIFLDDMKEVVLSWPYKDCVLEGGMTQEDQKREEIFWNTTLAPDDITRLLDPKVFTKFKRITGQNIVDLDAFNCDSKGTITDNLIIKGNNLLVLASLRKHYREQIKLIYIDPPYNTGGSGDTFFYNNNFKHSTWYVFMKNRLEIAKELMSEDGFIAIAIDHFELFYLGIIADEIFGRENRVGIISVVHKPEGRNQEKFFATSNEFMLVYAKNKTIAKFNTVVLSDEKLETYNEIDETGIFKLSNYLRSGGGDANLRKNKPAFYYPIYVAQDLSKVSLESFAGASAVYPVTNNGQERTWKTKANTLEQFIQNGRIVAQKDKNGKIQIFEKYYAEEKGQLVKTHWIDKRYNAINQGTKVVEELLGSKEFSFPKSVYLIQDVVKLMADKDSIILDFFAGSGTTAHAVLDLNKEDGGTRQFIICEQLDYAETVTSKRVKKVIENNAEGDFVYMELAEWNESWLEKIINSTTDAELETLWVEIQANAFLNYQVDTPKIEAQGEDFNGLNLVDKQKFLVECLDMNHLYINFSEIDDITYEITNDYKLLNRVIYN